MLDYCCTPTTEIFSIQLYYSFFIVNHSKPNDPAPADQKVGRNKRVADKGKGIVMKSIALGTLALAIASSAGAAFAADLPSRKEPPPFVAPPPPLWTGFYVGLNLGGGWRDNSGGANNWWLWNTPTPVANSVTPTPTPPDPHKDHNGGDWSSNPGGGTPTPTPVVNDPVVAAPTWWAFTNNNRNNSAGVVGGGQIGFNYQFAAPILVGVETDFQGTSLGSGGGSNWGFGAGGARLTWFGTVRGRLGWLVTPTLLLYGTGGFAYGQVQGGGWARFSQVGTGWTAGGGVEWMFLPNWSAKLEYLYADIGNFNRNAGWLTGGFGDWGWASGGGDRQFRFNTVRAGVNWHFNFGGLGSNAPVLAKY
jgi:outer membrane immunogenic protein